MTIHKFLTKKQTQLDIKLNKVLRSLVNVDTKRYQKNTDVLIEAIKRKGMCDYQSQLLSTAFSSFKLDIDCLTFTVKCSASVISKLINEHDGLLNVKAHGIKEIIRVESVKIDDINKDIIRGENKKRPFYKLLYLIMVNGIEEPVRLYISDGTAENSTIGLRFDFNPKHYNCREITAIFLHVESIVGARIYTSLINKARITRLDTGFIVFGLSYLFVYGFVTDKRFKGSECFTESDNGVTETTWLGTFSKIRLYDKTLELLRKSKLGEKLFGQWAMSTRFEYENRAKSRLKLSDLENSSLMFANLQVVDPSVLPLLSDKQLIRLLKNRTNRRVKSVIKKLAKIIGKEVPTISLDKDRLESERTRVLSNYKKLILEPRKNFKRLN
jgi:DNA helicase-2/ATP-dependent DNA helicase PcrA